MEFETYTYWVEIHNLPAIFNGDETGMEVDEIRNLDGFLNSVQDAHGIGHWSDVEGSETFRRCDVCGLRGDCVEIQYHVPVKV